MHNSFILLDEESITPGDLLEPRVLPLYYRFYQSDFQLWQTAGTPMRKTRNVYNANSWPVFIHSLRRDLPDSLISSHLGVGAEILIRPGAYLNRAWATKHSKPNPPFDGPSYLDWLDDAPQNQRWNTWNTWFNYKVPFVWDKVVSGVSVWTELNSMRSGIVIDAGQTLEVGCSVYVGQGGGNGWAAGTPTVIRPGGTCFEGGWWRPWLAGYGYATMVFPTNTADVIQFPKVALLPRNGSFANGTARTDIEFSNARNSIGASVCPIQYNGGFDYGAVEAFVPIKNAPFKFRKISTSGSLPAPLMFDTLYYMEPVVPSEFSGKGEWTIKDSAGDAVPLSSESFTGSFEIVAGFPGSESHLNAGTLFPGYSWSSTAWKEEFS